MNLNFMQRSERKLAGGLVGVLILALSISATANRPAGYEPEEDWLISPESFPARVDISTEGDRITLENGLIRRVIHRGNWSGTREFYNVMLGENLLRAVRPEATLSIDGRVHQIGGIAGQTNQAYLLPEWFNTFEPPTGGWRLVSAEVTSTIERMAWKRVRHTAPDAHWPPHGQGLKLLFACDQPELEGIHVVVRYEIYDDIPALMKWIEVENRSEKAINVDNFTSEVLAVVPYEDPVEFRNLPLTPPRSLHVETDYAFQGMSHKNSSQHSVQWKPDPSFGTQVNYLKQTPCQLEVSPRRGPDQTVLPGGSFRSFYTFELVHDSEDRERRGLAHRKLYRTLAPWVTENPLILHVVSVDDKIVRRSIDQAAECGFEMVSLSFGSGLNMEDETGGNLEKFKALTDYAKERGIHLGGYSLLSSRRIGNGMDVVSPEGEQPTHGNCPALASEWGQEYFRKLRKFFDTTGFLQFTHDGSYPGDWDVTARPPLQKGLNDSQWVQWKIITDFYQDLRAKGAYLRIPDYYYMAGANECGMGYREVNWSLPRAEQVLHTRQNIFDGSWQKTPSMGWMFVPLTQYHGGGAAATIEPLSEHLPHYEKMMASNMLLGVQAVYRGFRLYDTEETRDVVKRMVNLYKSHRDIIESDLLHLRRADGRQPDMMMHVNPSLDEKGFLVVFNPLDEEFVGTLSIPMYFTGLRGDCQVVDASGQSRAIKIDANYTLKLEVQLPSDSYAWYSFTETER